MEFSMMCPGLKASVVKFRGVYAAAAAKNEALAPYASVDALLDALKMSSPLTPEARDALIVALAAEQQRAPHPLWSTLLLAAFEPMLRRLATRVRGKKDGENEQKVLFAFLEAVQSLPEGEFAAAHLRRETERRVFRELRGDRRHAEMAEFDEETVAVRGLDPHAAFVAADDQKRFCAMMARIAGSEEGGAELADVLVATSAGEPLRDYVERKYADASEDDRRLTYGRLQRQRHRALEKLRETKAVGWR